MVNKKRGSPESPGKLDAKKFTASPVVPNDTKEMSVKERIILRGESAVDVKQVKVTPVRIEINASKTSEGINLRA